MGDPGDAKHGPTVGRVEGGELGVVRVDRSRPPWRAVGRRQYHDSVTQNVFLTARLGQQGPPLDLVEEPTKFLVADNRQRTCHRTGASN